MCQLVGWKLSNDCLTNNCHLWLNVFFVKLVRYWILVNLNATLESNSTFWLPSIASIVNQLLEQIMHGTNASIAHDTLWFLFFLFACTDSWHHLWRYYPTAPGGGNGIRRFGLSRFSQLIKKSHQMPPFSCIQKLAEFSLPNLMNFEVFLLRSFRCVFFDGFLIVWHLKTIYFRRPLVHFTISKSTANIY